MYYSHLTPVQIIGDTELRKSPSMVKSLANVSPTKFEKGLRKGAPQLDTCSFSWETDSSHVHKCNLIEGHEKSDLLHHECTCGHMHVLI